MANMKLVISFCSIVMATLVGAPLSPSAPPAQFSSPSAMSISPSANPPFRSGTVRSLSPAPRTTSAQASAKLSDLYLWLQKYAPTRSTVKTGGDEMLNPKDYLDEISAGDGSLGALGRLHDLKNVIDGKTGQKVVIAVAIAGPVDNVVYRNVIAGYEPLTAKVTLAHEWRVVDYSWVEGDFCSSAVMLPILSGNEDSNEARFLCLRTHTFMWPSSKERGILGVFVGYVPTTDFGLIALNKPKQLL